MLKPDKSIRWYLAGPMTGIPAFNYPYFDVVASRLRADGYDVLSPAELDFPEARRIIMTSPNGDPKDLPPGTTWGKALARDIAALTDTCGGIILLPHWWKSRGARLEATCGLLCNKQFALWGRYTEVATPSYAYPVALRLAAWLSEV